MTMKSSSLLLLISVAYLFLFAEAVSQGGSQAVCSIYEKLAADGKSCPKIHKPMCGTDGQTYKNLCEFCKVAMHKMESLVSSMMENVDSSNDKM